MQGLCSYPNSRYRQGWQAEGHCLEVPFIDSVGSANNIALLSLSENLPEVYPRNDF